MSKGSQMKPEVKKVVLAAINAKYIHSCLAVYSLRANAGKYKSQVSICEYTINHSAEDILAALYEEKADIIGFSCYLWNIEYVRSIAADLKRVSPELRIVAGGPEVSGRPEEFLRENDCFDLVMVGEGEETFAEFLDYYIGGSGKLAEIQGLFYREDGEILRTLPRAGLSMDALAFPYEGVSRMENRIIYYESMRGCPFSCSYCLSSIEKSVRIKSLEKTKREIDFFLQAKVPQVKFVDRTFNCSHEHAYGIWSHIKERDNGITNFHFEIAADLLREEDFCLFRDMRQGLLQFEAGVQSTYPATIEAIGRTMDLERLRVNIGRLRENRNIHIHLDLIAGLPFEDYNRFSQSFCDVYRMGPDQLQLGFLKLLYGSGMRMEEEKYGIIASSRPSYEVHATNWLSYEDIRKLKQVEEMVEVYYNSAQFMVTLDYLEHFFPDSFAMYESLGKYYKRNNLFGRKHSRLSRYDILWDFAIDLPEVSEECLREMLTYDLYSREYVKNPPSFVKARSGEEKEKIREFFQRAKKEEMLPAGYGGYTAAQLQHMLYLHIFHYDMELSKRTGEAVKEEPYALLFDYRERSPLDHSARVLRIGREYFL